MMIALLIFDANLRFYSTSKLKEKKQKEIQDRIEKDRMLLAQPAEAPPASAPAATPSSTYSSSAKPLSTPL